MVGRRVVTLREDWCAYRPPASTPFAPMHYAATLRVVPADPMALSYVAWESAPIFAGRVEALVRALHVKADVRAWLHEGGVVNVDA